MNPAYIDDIVARALAEDLGGRGDVTSDAVIPADARARFVIAARSKGVLAGREIAESVFRHCSLDLQTHWQAKDGDSLSAGEVVMSVEGPVRAILAAERTALNFLGRLSGIATLTRAHVDAVAGTGVAIAHTRKTTPTLRALELAAVRAGGGASHRFGLDDAILIKDNHVAIAGSAGEAVRRARAHAGHMTRVAVEIDRLDQLEEAIAAGADSILLDNFTLDDMARAVDAAKGRVILEASGGVTLETLRPIAETGVDVISVGALTHSAPNFDFGMDEA
ncbi:MAG: carboxylating nicotinate-nucleotide diphosphorylase [Caulobacterales bacterium]|uniref:carboxylating nicotinate-nucleotide diphosphorylase n=1 Tax=Glycocaulis sp. TaxID=1969725 RepID=UPI003F9EEDE7